jgi:regulator of nucleoside diphosphate kinase
VLLIDEKNNVRPGQARRRGRRRGKSATRRKLLDRLLNKRITSAADSHKLVAAVDRARRSWWDYVPYLDLFRGQLRRARVVPPGEVPEDVITMNSRFAVVDPQEDTATCYTLVYPEEAAPLRGKVSVLSPMGMALLGARVGEEVFWMSSDGPRVGKVRHLLYQPEAARDFHL